MKNEYQGQEIDSELGKKWNVKLDIHRIGINVARDSSTWQDCSRLEHPHVTASTRKCIMIKLVRLVIGPTPEMKPIFSSKVLSQLLGVACLEGLGMLEIKLNQSLCD